MTSRFSVAALASAFLISCATISGSVVNNRPVLVADGVLHRHVVQDAGPWNIHVVAIDLKQADLIIESARAFDSLKGRENTSSIARRKTDDRCSIIAAMNADFFNMETGENDQNQVIDGEIVKGVKTRIRHQFGMGFSRKPYIERFSFDGKGFTATREFSFEAVNVLKDSAVVVLNHFFGQYTRKENDAAVLVRRVRVAGDTIVAIIADSLKPGQQVLIDPSSLVLRARGPQREVISNLSSGDSARIVLGFLPRRERLKTLVGGLPRIVADGRNIAIADSMPGLTGKFTETRHPRSGVGFSRDSTVIYFITVDGRQAASAGMSLSEFADAMVQQGCYHGLNLDGGGSTAMVIKGEVVNKPSDTSGERPVANVLLAIKKK